ncbi:hypothetical protein JXB02_03785 [Candidatus Woesearchaeota archaeon]|nr:hypothetical protein [Candidatus Woesearchaeota archaeon]
MRFRDAFLIAYLSLFFAAAPLASGGPSKKEQAKQQAGHVLTLKDPQGRFYTWEKLFPDTLMLPDTIGIFEKKPSSGAYPDNLASIVDQLAPDTSFARWNSTPVPVFYGSNVSSGVPFDSIGRAFGEGINAGTGRGIVAEGAVSDYGIIFQYADSSSISIARNPDGSPQLAVVTVQKDLYDPAAAIARLYAAALGFRWSLDRTSVSGGASAFSPLDVQSLATFFAHPFGYDLRPSWGDSARGDVEKPTMALDAPAQATANAPVALDASASTDNTGIVEYQWDTDYSGFFDPDTATTTSTLEHVFTNPEPSDRTIMVVGRDANGNRGYAGKDISVIASPTAPVFGGYHVHSASPNLTLNIQNIFSDLSNPIPLFTYFIISTDFPNLGINPSNGVMGSTFYLPDSMAGKSYYAVVAADNGSEVTTATIDWIVNRYRHVIDVFYLKGGQTQTEQLNGTDRLTDYARNVVTPAGFFAYSIQSTPQELQEVADRIVQRPAWAEEDLLHYNFTTIPSWPNISATMDSVFQNISPYELRGIGFTVSSN